MLKYEEIIKQLTLEEKASLMSGKDFWTTVPIERLNIPSIFLSDGPHGLRKQALGSDHLGLNKSVPATCFPTAATVANSWDIELGQLIGNTIAKEARAQDINVILGPGTNIKRSPLCGRNFEYFSEDPYLAGKMSASYIKGFQSLGGSACLKHFACNSEEINRQTLDSIVDERTLREIYLRQFEIAIKEGKPKSIMTSYNLLNGEYTNENHHLLVDILRKEWGFAGVIVSDWGGNNDRVKALKCYSELEMPSSNGDTPIDIVNAIKNGEISEELLDENVDNLLDFIFDVSNEEIAKPFNIEEHHKIALKAAEESIVLLENRNDVLPLNKEQNIAFIGDFIFKPRYQGAGSSMVNPTKLDTSLDVIRKEFPNITGIVKGFKRDGTKSNYLLKQALKVASKADIIVSYLGLDELSECEGLDRKNMSLRSNQLLLVDELVKLNKPVIVILSAGSAIELPFKDKVDGIIHATLPGQAGAQAIVNVLLGKVNPSGKLSETYPIKYEDTISSVFFPSTSRVSLYKEGLYVGYRYYEKANIPVAYEFGYGLSYTTFEYSDFKVTDKGINFKITNTGKIAGKEIAQLYISKPNSLVIRPEKELKGFIKVELKPNETKDVFIPFDEYSFDFFNTKTNSWEIEPGEYQVSVGSSSLNIKYKEIINKEGTTTDIKSDVDLPTYMSGKVKNVSNDEFSKLLGRDIPSGELNFIDKKKKRIIVNYNTTLVELKYAKGWFGRFLCALIKFGIGIYGLFASKEAVMTMSMGVLYQPMRGIARMTGGVVRWSQLDGLIDAFNGNFSRGIKTYFREGRKHKKVKRKAK